MRIAAFLLALLAVPAAAAEEVPFVVSPDSVTLAMLQAAKVVPEDYVIDLGSSSSRRNWSRRAARTRAPRACPGA
jgi:hypothetical protein